MLQICPPMVLKKQKMLKPFDLAFDPDVRHAWCTRETSMHVSCIPCMLYFEATTKLWEQSQPGECWECCPAPGWYGWSEGWDQHPVFMVQGLEEANTGWSGGFCCKGAVSVDYMTVSFITQNDQVQKNNRWQNWLLCHSQQCHLYFQWQNIYPGF